MIVRRFFEPLLAQTSYLIGCGAAGEAIVIDPNRDADQLHRAPPQPTGLRITHVTETHIHADFLSGSRELAARTGATLLLSDEGDADWNYAFAAEARADPRRRSHRPSATCRSTSCTRPGHTPEHLTFLDHRRRGRQPPIAAATGDFMFVGDVGRPDLLEKAAQHQGHDGGGRADAVSEPAGVQSARRVAADLAGPRRRLGVRQGHQRRAAQHARLRAAVQLGVQGRQRGGFVATGARRPARSAEVLRDDEADEQGRPASARRLRRLPPRHATTTALSDDRRRARS